MRASLTAVLGRRTAGRPSYLPHAPESMTIATAPSTAGLKCMQQSTLTEWRCGLTVALQLAMPVTRGSNPSLYHVFLVYLS